MASGGVVNRDVEVNSLKSIFPYELTGSEAEGELDERQSSLKSRTCCCGIQLSGFSLKTTVFILLVFCSPLVMLLFVAAPGVCLYIPGKVIPLSDPTNKGTVSDELKNSKVFNILFYGDSMLSEPLSRYNLVGRIKAYVPSYHFTARVFAFNAIKMRDLRRNIAGQLAVSPPLDGIIIMCDSDITDVVFDRISDQQAAALLEQYSADLRHVIGAAKNASVPIAISSPVGVLLEGPLGAPDSVRYHHKKGAISAYTAATKAAAEDLGAPFVDIRSATLAAIPVYRQYYLGCVTYDGEHPNVQGTDIFAKLYSRVVHQWFYDALVTSKAP